jgi:hypothetical protein
MEHSYKDVEKEPSSHTSSRCVLEEPSFEKISGTFFGDFFLFYFLLFLFLFLFFFFPTYSDVCVDQ